MIQIKEAIPVTVRITPEPARVDPVLDHLAQLMDGLFEIPGVRWRFGLDALVGLIPGFGDAATTFVSLYILSAAARCGVPRVTLFRMGMNIAIDSIAGSVPIVGDVFDVWWKANLKNVELLRRSVEAAPQQARKGVLTDWLFIGGIVLFVVGLLATSMTLTYFMIKFIAGKV